jgi:alpha-glucosidase
MHPDPAALESVHSRNDPEIGLALAAMREAAGDAVLIGEVYLPSASLGPYLDHLDLAFAFEFLHAPWRADRLAEVIAAAARLDRVAWVLSNHDFRRLVSRLGEEAARAAALLLLTLPGAAFVYQGEEIGMEDGSDQGIDRVRRDRFRHPMQWDASPGGGFSTGDPWLEPSDPERRAVATQRDDPGSLLALYRRLIALRRELRGPLEPLPAPPGLLVFRRGEHAVAINFNQRAAKSPLEGELLLATHPDAESAGARVARTIPPSGGIVVRLQRV